MNIPNDTDTTADRRSPEEETFLTEGQLGKRWFKAGSTLQNDRVAGRGPKYCKLGGSVRYRLSDVEQFEADALRMSTSQNGGQK